MKPLTNEENKWNFKQKVCYKCKKTNLILMMPIKNIKFEITVFTEKNIEELLMIFSI